MYSRQNDGHTPSLELSDSLGNAYQFGTLLMGPTLVVVCSLPIKNMCQNKVESNHLFPIEMTLESIGYRNLIRLSLILIISLCGWLK
jgi:hypothetical protein